MEPKDYREAGYASPAHQWAVEGSGWIEVRHPDPGPPPTTPEGILLEPGDRSNEDATQRALDGPGFTRVTKRRPIECGDCDHLNPPTATHCENCGVKWHAVMSIEPDPEAR